MSVRDIQRRFKQAPWESRAEVERFVEDAAPDVDAHELARMVDALTNRKLVADRRRHQLRCQAFEELTLRGGDRSLHGPLVKALKNADSTLRDVLVRLLPRVNDVENHGELCDLLKLPDAAVRQAAARVLMARNVGGRHVLRYLSQCIAEPRFAGRAEAIDIIAAVAPPSFGVPMLRDALAHGSIADKSRALAHLGDEDYVGDLRDEALDAIAYALDDEADGVVTQAIARFGALSDEESFFIDVVPLLEDAPLDWLKAAVPVLGRFPSQRTVALLEPIFHDGPDVIRLLVLDALNEMGGEECLSLLVDALGHESIGVRTRASEVFGALSRSGRLDLSATIVWLLRSHNPTVRRMAAEVVASAQDHFDTLWPKLLTFLRDEDWWVRERVTDGLVKLAGEKLTRYLVGFLSDPSDVVRRFAVDTLGRIRDPRALGALVKTARDDADWWVRERAIDAAAELGDARAVPHVADIMMRQPDMRMACIAALEVLEASQAAEQIAAVLDDTDPTVRRAALAFLERFDARALAPDVTALLRDDDPTLRRAARDLLIRWNRRSEVENNVAGLGAQAVAGLLDKLLLAVADVDGVDMLVGPGRRVYIKRLGQLVPLGDTLAPDLVRALLLPQLTLAQREALEDGREVDLSYEVKGQEEGQRLRFRANVYQERGGVAAVFRRLQNERPDLEVLGLPPVVGTLTSLKNGLVLVGGPTGSGKSTTLAAMIDRINQGSARHIISLEDPIEVIHEPVRSVVTQREIGTHTKSFQASLRSTLRQDPDVILVGEMRDLETISFAVTAAETGHLVFGTVHTVSAHSTVDRLVNAYPADEQEHVRSALADTLRAVVCQQLVRHVDGASRCLAVEVMLVNDAIRHLIRHNKTHQMPATMATNRDKGMQLMDADLLRLYREGRISAEDGYLKAHNKSEFEDIIAAEEERAARAEAAGAESEGADAVGDAPAGGASSSAGGRGGGAATDGGAAASGGRTSEAGAR